MADAPKSLAELFRIPLQTEINPNHTIVIAEDQQDVRLIISSHLKKLGFRNIAQAQDGYHALNIIKDLTAERKRIAVVICDEKMPTLGGFDVLNELRENPKLDRPPFAMAIEDPSKEKIMLALENGVDEIMVKPFTLADLFPKVQVAFRQYHNPKNPEKVYELAKQLLRSGHPAQAKKVYMALAQENTSAARPWVGLARASLAEGDVRQCMQELQEAETRNPNFVHIFSVRGKAFLLDHCLEDAVKQFKKAIEMSPLNPVRYEDAAEPLFALKQFQEGINLLNEAISKEIEFPSLHHHLSQGYFALKDFEKSLLHVRKALIKEPQNVLYLNQLGIAQKEAGQFEEALSTYNSIIKIDNDNRAAYYNKAILLESRGDRPGAIKLMKRILEKHPEFEPAKNKLKELQGGSAA